MKNKNNRINMASGLRILSAGALLVGSTAYASGWMMGEPGDPSTPSLIQSNIATQRLVDMMMKSAPHAAAGANEWFQTPSVFAEYGYNAVEDTRGAGFDTDINSATVGLNFLTKCDIAAGVMVNYGSTNGDNSYDGDNLGLTLSLAKSYDWFFMGFSTGYDNSDSRPGGGLQTDTDCYTLAPFIGAMYVKGNFSFSTAPTMVIRWQDFDTAGVSADSSDATFGLMNTASYQINEALSVSLMANWNCVVREDPVATTDHNWYSVGTKVSYRLTDKFTTYASYMIDLGNDTYDNQRATAGLSMEF
jgi:hypothetical protein